MNNTGKLVIGTVALMAGVLVATSSSARSQNSNGPVGPINLQTTTPGTAQVGHGNITGTFKAAYLKGNGLGVTGLNANNIAVGTLSDDRLSNTVAHLNAAQTFQKNVVVNAALGVGGSTFGNFKLMVFNGDFSLQNSGSGSGVQISDGTTTYGNSAIFINGEGSATTHEFSAVSSNGAPRGRILVSSGFQSPAAGIYVGGDNIGSIFADVKNFRVPNPRNDAEDIVYACVEGPEAAAYVRGTAHLVNGHARIALPQHFSDVTVSEGMTVQLTPCSRTSEGLAVENRSNQGFDVYELHSGKGSYDVDWEVKAVRYGHTDYKPVRPWDEVAPMSMSRGKAWSMRESDIAAKASNGLHRRLSRP
ncbi:MAG: hypothetical protein JSS66_15860 [Armatimonadetes bacterium]|nr:hypothetical protein [Armatimonadota bacterium]